MGGTTGMSLAEQGLGLTKVLRTYAEGFRAGGVRAGGVRAVGPEKSLALHSPPGYFYYLLN